VGYCGIKDAHELGRGPVNSGGRTESRPAEVRAGAGVNDAFGCADASHFSPVRSGDERSVWRSIEGLGRRQ
jgi:hypothetical protein